MDRRIVRREFNKLGFAVLAQQLIFMTVSIIFLFIFLTVKYLTAPDPLAGADEVMQEVFQYSSIAAPVCEELVYRGAVMRYLERYGSFFAVLISALLFGLMHGNIAQVPFAFAVGIVLGIIAQEYSLTASVLIHLFNNLHSDLTGWAELYFGRTVSTIEFYGILLVSLLGLVLWTVKRRRVILEYLKKIQIKEELFWCFMTSGGVILLLAYNIWQMIISVTVLS